MSIRMGAFFGGLVGLSLVCPATAVEPSPARTGTGAPSRLAVAVNQYFVRMDEAYKPGDLITREQVAPLLDELAKTGFPVHAPEDVLTRIPAADEVLPRLLATTSGKKFMRRVARYPGAYDRLDRLSVMPHGAQTIRDLIKGPGGERMIEYMVDTRGGKAMGNMLSKAPNGRDFNKPTTRIYTASQLVEALSTEVKPASGPSRDDRPSPVPRTRPAR